MKREASDNGGGNPQKRYRRGDTEVRLLIPSKVAGSIIGKGGSKITSLRNTYNASITVPDCPGPERILSMSSDLETILKIVQEVIPNMEENGSRVVNDELDIRMLIHQSQAGCVIGMNGTKIRELRDKTGARIKIFSNTAPQSTDRIIQIIGRAECCVDAIKEIVNLVKTAPIKGPEQNYNPYNYDDYYSEEYGGYGGAGNMGGPGPNRRGGGRMGPPARNEMPGRFGGGNRGPPPRNNFGPPRGFGGPSPRNSEFGGFGGGNGPRNNSNFGGGPRNDDFGMSDDFNGGPNNMNNGGGSQNSSDGDFNSNVTRVTIPKDLAGAIIGKGGSRIRKIRQSSGAGITIDDPLAGANDRIITIKGQPQQIQMAQYLLQQSVHENKGGGGGGRLEDY